MSETHIQLPLVNMPRRIWFHWAQGRAALPPVAARCLAGWEAKNPDWELVFLDAQNVWDWLDHDELPVAALRATSEQVYANAVRLCLLSRHGGVWADATTWCRRPLSTWLTDLPSEFFAFADPGPDRPMSNWFMASQPGGYIARTMAQEYLRIFWRVGALKRFPDPLVHDFLQRSGGTDIFLEPLLLERLRGYPFYLFHYLFASLCRTNACFGQRWRSVPKLSASACLEPGHAGFDKPPSQNLKQRWVAADAPMYKLSWRVGQLVQGSILERILADDL